MAKIIELEITNEMRERAEERLQNIPELRNSITKNKAKLHGLLAEEMLAPYLGATVEDHYDYDLSIGEIKLDSKTVRTKVEPLPQYMVSLADYNVTQKCDYYVFSRITYDMTRGWFVGMMHKEFFMANASRHYKGEPEGDNGHRVTANCRKMSIEDLWDFE